MASTNNDDYGQFIYIDIEDYIVKYDDDNRPIYCKVGSKYYRYVDNSTSLADYDNKYWLEIFKTHAIGLFVVGIVIYMIL